MHALHPDPQELADRKSIRMRNEGECSAQPTRESCKAKSPCVRLRGPHGAYPSPGREQSMLNGRACHEEDQLGLVSCPKPVPGKVYYRHYEASTALVLTNEDGKESLLFCTRWTQLV